MKGKIIFLIAVIFVFGISGCVSSKTADDVRSDKVKVEGCMENDTQADMNNYVSNTIDDFGIELYVDNITSTGLTLICTQVGGDIEGEIRTDNMYMIEKKVDGAWQRIELQENVYWEGVLLTVSEGESLEWNIDWSKTYGDLPTGEYRIGKKFTEHETEKDVESQYCFVEFLIKKGQ